MTPRIPFDVPVSDERRDRVEREVIARVAALRAADRADLAVTEPRGRAWRIAGLCAAGAAAAIAIVVVATRGGGAREDAPVASPSRIVTPVGARSRLTVGDAVIDAGSDTSVEVVTAADGAITLQLARGSVDCDVAPRAGRPPFRVVAGELVVEVVGTRFTVTRTPAPRVDVARGTVRVTTPSETTYVAAGESWPAVAAAPAPMKTEPPVQEIEVDAAPATPRHAEPSPTSAYQAAAHEADPVKRARAYRQVANGNGIYAALALYDLADLHANDPSRALADLDEYARRFPRGANAEDVAWQRVLALRTAARPDDARAAARDYLARYPHGTYASVAARMMR